MKAAARSSRNARTRLDAALFIVRRLKARKMAFAWPAVILVTPLTGQAESDL